MAADFIDTDGSSSPYTTTMIGSTTQEPPGWAVALYALVALVLLVIIIGIVVFVIHLRQKRKEPSILALKPQKIKYQSPPMSKKVESPISTTVSPTKSPDQPKAIVGRLRQIASEIKVKKAGSSSSGQRAAFCVSGRPIEIHLGPEAGASKTDPATVQRLRGRKKKDTSDSTASGSLTDKETSAKRLKLEEHPKKDGSQSSLSSMHGHFDPSVPGRASLGKKDSAGSASEFSDLATPGPDQNIGKKNASTQSESANQKKNIR